MVVVRRVFGIPHAADRRVGRLLAGLLIAATALAGCGGGKQARTSSDPVVRKAQVGVDAAPPPLRAYRGPARGPSAQRPALIVFVAADLTDGGVAAVARGVQQAARAIGWPLQILDGQASTGGQSQALMSALHERPGGIILGGFDAAEQSAAMREARALGVPVVGWHATATPGPDAASGLFTNVTAEPAVVARLAADYVIASSGGTAGAAVFTDSEYASDSVVGELMASDIRACRRCSVLQVIDTPVATAATGTAAIAAALLERFGRRLGYFLAVNGAYVDGARTALLGSGRSGDQPPFSVAAGEGDESEFARIRADQYQRASSAEPLNLEGWQLIDEVNRARARQPASGFVAPPRLITQFNVPNSGVFDPSSGYRANYVRIWRR